MSKQTAMASKKIKNPKTKSKEENKQALMLKPIKNDASDTSVKISTNVINPKTVIEIFHSVQLTELELRISQVEVQNPLNNIHKLNKLEIAKKRQCSLSRDEVLDKLLQSEFQEKIGENRQPISSLPIFEKREEILDIINTNQVVVICGEPGCGKTTQIPQFILDEYIKSGNGSLCKIVSTQPYKKNVTTAVDKVSEERKGIFGNADGINYQFRFHKSISRNLGSITYCTSGILMKQVANSSFLSKITHVIIDEIQERDKSTDFLLSFMKELISSRDDIKLILICTSIYSKKIVKYFNKCLKINVSPELHPVEEYFLEDIIMFTNFKNLAENGHFEKDKNFKKHEKRRKYPMALKRFVETYEKLNNTNGYLIISLIKYIYTKYHDGNILILVPSIFDIRFLETKIKEGSLLSSKTQVTTLTEFDISTGDKTFNFNHEIFLTTNEKFVNFNVSNIVFVIDSGRIQVKHYDITNVEIARNEWISQKTSNQRKRLASRYKPGVCFHLFSQESIESLVKYPIPEIMKCDLERVIIEIKEFGIENAELFLQNCLSSPDAYCIRQTIENLKNHNILSNEEYLTPLGLHIAKLPLKYAVGKMVIFGAYFNCLEPILTIAAYLSFKSIFKGKDTEIHEMKHHLSFSCDSDILMILNLLNEFEKFSEREDEFFELYLIKPAIFKEMNNIKQQLSERLFGMNILPTSNYKLLEYNMNSENTKLIKTLLSVALNQNIAVIRNHKSDKLKNIFIETATQKNVFIYHSVNTGKTCLPTPLLLYRSSFEEKYNFIQETTFVTPLQVLFFANEVQYSTENQESNYIIIVADFLKIFCSQSTFSIIRLVQENFNKWFDYKLRNPGYVDWTKKSWDTSVLRAVIHLLNNEEENNFLF